MATSKMLGAVGPFVLLPIVALIVATTSVQAAEGDVARATVNFRLNCSGCHREDGTGQSGLVPALAGSIGKVFSASGGREYVGRIPGVANSFLDDQELSEVLNWLLPRFDSEHLRGDFLPYTAAEVGRLRKTPMSDVMAQRAKLVSRVADVEPATPAAPASAPPSFALCGACHPTSPGGANGIGPNLRGIVGRSPGTAPGYLYSAAMKGNPVVWDVEGLDRYIASPATAVPGNAMSFRGEPDPAERAAIIAYLKTLK